jgi:hypothetical protein
LCLATTTGGGLAFGASSQTTGAAPSFSNLFGASAATNAPSATPPSVFGGAAQQPARPLFGATTTSAATGQPPRATFSFGSSGNLFIYFCATFCCLQQRQHRQQMCQLLVEVPRLVQVQQLQVAICLVHKSRQHWRVQVVRRRLILALLGN